MPIPGADEMLGKLVLSVCFITACVRMAATQYLIANRRETSIFQIFNRTRIRPLTVDNRSSHFRIEHITLTNLPQGVNIKASTPFLTSAHVRSHARAVLHRVA
jgi:hypothetical protein